MAALVKCCGGGVNILDGGYGGKYAALRTKVLPALVGASDDGVRGRRSPPWRRREGYRCFFALSHWSSRCLRAKA
jgi:hypothetical protein